LGSTVALVDSSGNIQTTYAYDPFGNTTVSGAVNTNVSQYTGRENEGNGLYFYRARYYSPLLGRFISEDPLGLDGGDVNVYAYVGGDPINFVDPDGTDALETGVSLLSAGWQVFRGGAGSQIVKLVAGGSAEGAGGGPAGVLVGIGVLAVGGIVDARVQYNAAIDNEEAAYAAELAAVAKLNAVLLAHPRPLPLAGRKTRGGNNWEECEFEHLDRALNLCIYTCSDGQPWAEPPNENGYCRNTTLRPPGEKVHCERLKENRRGQEMASPLCCWPVSNGV
jgi:RHS repeat-associated protein